MKKIIVLSVIALMGFGGYAFAEGYGGRHMRGGDCDKMEEHVESMLRLAERAIQPTKAQMPAWEDVKDAVEDISEQMEEKCEMRKEKRGEGKGRGDDMKSPLDRLEKMEEKAKMKLETIQSLKKSVTPFYEQLSDEQKQAVSDLMRGNKHHRKKHWMK